MRQARGALLSRPAEGVSDKSSQRALTTNSRTRCMRRPRNGMYPFDVVSGSVCEQVCMTKYGTRGVVMTLTRTATMNKTAKMAIFASAKKGPIRREKTRSNMFGFFLYSGGQGFSPEAESTYAGRALFSRAHSTYMMLSPNHDTFPSSSDDSTMTVLRFHKTANSLRMQNNQGFRPPK